MKRLLVPLLAPCGGAAAAPHTSNPAVVLHGQRFAIEPATEPTTGRASRKHGLMMRPELPADHSMPSGVPPCEPALCPSNPSDVPARYVPELPAGRDRRTGAQTGDVLSVDGAIGAVRRVAGS